MERLLIMTGREWFVGNSNYMYLIHQKGILWLRIIGRYMGSIRMVFMSRRWWLLGRIELIKWFVRKSVKKKISLLSTWKKFSLTLLMYFADKISPTSSKQSVKPPSIYKILIVTSQGNLMVPPSMKSSFTNFTKYSSPQMSTILCRAWPIILIFSGTSETSPNLKSKLIWKQLSKIRSRTWLNFLELIKKKIGFGKSIIQMSLFIDLSVDQKCWNHFTRKSFQEKEITTLWMLLKWTNCQMATLPPITEPTFVQSGHGIKTRNPTGLLTLESTKNSTHVRFLINLRPLRWPVQTFHEGRLFVGEF